MKVVILLAMVAAAVARPEESFYDPKYDNFNVEEIIDNTRLLKSYALCLRGEGRCTADGTTFKKWLPEAIQSTCGRCSEKQKVLIAKVIKALKVKLPEQHDALIKIHDPEKKHTAELDGFLQKYAA